MVDLEPRMIAMAISAVSFLLNLLVLGLLILKGGRSRSTYLWCAFMGLIAVLCFSEALIRSTEDYWTAIMWFRPLVFAGAFLPPVLFHFSLEFPSMHWILRRRMTRIITFIIIYVPSVILLIRAEAISVIVGPAPMANTIWGPMYARDSLTQHVASDVYIAHYAFLSGLVFAGIFMIFQNLTKVKTNIERKQLTMMAWALSVIFVPGVVIDAFLSIFLNIYTEIMSILLVLLAIVTAIAIVKYKFLVVLPATEDISVDLEETPDVEPGYGYIVPESSRKQGMNLFLSALAQKREGIIITNKDPMDLRVDYGIKRTPIIYMGEKTNYEMRIDPANLDGLSSSLTTFTTMTKSPVLMVDWDASDLGGTIKRSSSGGRGGTDAARAPFDEWFKGDNLWDTMEQMTKMLAGGMSIMVFQDMKSKKVIRSQRPLQHIHVINFFVIEKLLNKILEAIEKVQGQPGLFLKELAALDKFFEEWTYSEGAVSGPIEHIDDLDRASTINKLRTINIVLSRSSLKNANGAIAKVWKQSNLGGYTDEEISMAEGAINFLVSEDQAYPFDVMREFVASGFDGMCMSTRPPDKVEHMYALRDVEYRWITTSNTDDKRAIPASLEHIRRDLRAYIEDHNEGVVLLDGIELLVSRLGFENVQRFLHVIKDELAVTQARLLISVNPKAIDDQRLALIRREVEI